jgi:gas vesicle protein
MKLGKFIAGVGIGAVIGMLCAPKKGSELRGELKEKSQDLYDKAQNMTKDDVESLINNTIEEIKLAIDEFDVDEFKDTAGEKLGDIKTKLEQLATSVKSSDEYASFKESVAKVRTKFKEIKTKVQDKDFNVLQELDDAMDDIEDELDVIIEDLKD